MEHGSHIIRGGSNNRDGCQEAEEEEVGEAGTNLEVEERETMPLEVPWRLQ